MTKIEDLKKRLDRAKHDLEVSKDRAKQAAERVKTKNEEITRLTGELVSQLLIENSMDITDLSELLSEQQPTIDTNVTVEAELEAEHGAI